MSSLLFASGLLACFAFRSVAQPTLTEAIAQQVETYVDDSRFSGVVLVESRDEVVFERAYGNANIELSASNEIDTRFKLHSLTKTFTAVSVLRAADQGRLRLDDPISQYLDPCPDIWKGVAIEHLLDHSSGIPDHTGLLLASFRGSSAQTYQAIVPELENELLFTPGTSFRYSNSGYVLLELILEEVYGDRFIDILQREVFDPTGMNGAGVERAPDPEIHSYDGPPIVNGLASGYNGAPGKLQRSLSKMYVIPGAGAAYATAKDLSAFATAAFEGDLLSPEMKKRFVRVNPDIGVPYAMGVVVRDDGGRLQYRHDGGSNGYVSSLQFFPDDGFTVVVLSNYGFAPIGDIRSDIAGVLFAIPAEPGD